MTHDGAVRRPLFTVDAKSPSLLHLCGELDLVGAPTLLAALEPLAERGGTVGLDLAELTFMDSTGINALCHAARLIGERGRIVVFRPKPAVRRVLEICGLVGVIVIDDAPTPTSIQPV